MPNDFLYEEEESTETDHIQTSIPLALLNLQYTSVKIIMPPSSLTKKSKEKFSVVSLVSCIRAKWLIRPDVILISVAWIDYYRWDESPSLGCPQH